MSNYVKSCSLNILLKVYEECPCRNCANEDVCGIYSTPQTIKYDLTQEKRDTICVLNLINLFPHSEQ